MLPFTSSEAYCVGLLMQYTRHGLPPLGLCTAAALDVVAVVWVCKCVGCCCQALASPRAMQCFMVFEC